MLVALTDAVDNEIKTDTNSDEIVHSISGTHASTVVVLVRKILPSGTWFVFEDGEELNEKMG